MEAKGKSHAGALRGGLLCVTPYPSFGNDDRRSKKEQIGGLPPSIV